MSEDEEKQFVLQKNGNYILTLSNFKNMVLSVFKGNVYWHIWNNRNKMHVSLNLDELAYVLKNKTVIQDIMEQLLMPNVEKKIPNFPFEMQKNGNYVLDLSGDKRWCWVCSRGMFTATFGTTRIRNMFHWTAMNWCIYYQMKQTFIIWQNSYQNEIVNFKVTYT